MARMKDELNEHSSGTDLGPVYKTFLALAALGVFGGLLYSRPLSSSSGVAFGIFGAVLLVAGAAAFVGGLIGFVFAIPRSRQDQGPVAKAPTGKDRKFERLSDYSANTNLEQISDWLTKILVGISLVQFNSLVGHFQATATTLAPMLGDGLSARPVAMSLMTYFLSWGFFFAYLATRLWLPKALSRAEREEQMHKEEAELQSDLKALQRRAYDYLYQPEPGGFTRAIEELEAYQNKPGSTPNGTLSMYLAAAYGQKHAFEKGLGHADKLQELRDGAVSAVREALRLAPDTRPIIEQLYRGKHETENDLSTLHPDEELEALLAE